MSTNKICVKALILLITSIMFIIALQTYIGTESKEIINLCGGASAKRGKAFYFSSKLF